MIDSDHCFKKRDGISWQEMDGEVLILQTRESLVHELNTTAAAIWKLIDGNTSVSKITSQITDDFEVNSEELEKDMPIFMKELIDKELIV